MIVPSVYCFYFMTITTIDHINMITKYCFQVKNEEEIIERMTKLIKTLEKKVDDSKERNALIELVKVCILVLNSILNI